MKKYFWLFLIFLVTHFLSFSQNIEWAFRVDSCSSEFEKDKYSAKEVLGIPNADPRGQMLSVYAWAVKPNSLNREGVETAFIQVNFAKKRVAAEQIAVFENFNPGAVAEIFIQSNGIWKSVYLDTNVVARTGYRHFDKLRNENDEIDELDSNDRRSRKYNLLKNYFGTIHRPWLPFISENPFKAKQKYRILNVYFEKCEVSAVRVILNLYAIDGWNQVDAVALSDSRVPIKRPEPNLTKEPLFKDDKVVNLWEDVNSSYSEVSPVVSPDEKTLYFVRSDFPDNFHSNSQDIWFSRLKMQELSCTQKNGVYVKAKTPQKSLHFNRPFNNILPNAVFCFSNDGRKVYFNNNYVEYPKNDSIFTYQTTGISVAEIDSLRWNKPDDSQLQSLDSIFIKDFSNFRINSDNNILVATQVDSVSLEKMAVVFFKNKKGKWNNKPQILGNLEQEYEILSPFDEKNYVMFFDSVKINDTIYEMEIGNITWNEPKPLEFESLENDGNYVDIQVCDNGKVMFLSLENSKSKGAKDLYISFLQQNNTWSTPINLGDSINTISDDMSPFFDDDSTLYFASAGHAGFGERDIFFSKKLDNSWLKWSKPVNIGKIVNAQGSESYFHIAPQSKQAFFSCTEQTFGCKCKSDIFSIKMRDAIFLRIRGTVRDVETKKPLGAEVALTSLLSQNIFAESLIKFYSDSKTGKFDVTINKMIERDKLGKFAMTAKRKDYTQTDSVKNVIPYSFVNIFTNKRYITLERDLFLMTPHIADPIIDDVVVDNPQVKKDSLLPKDTLNPVVARQDTVKPVVVKDPDDIPVKKNEVIVTPVVPLKMDTARIHECGCVFIKDDLYYYFPPKDSDSEAQLFYVKVAYETQFDYNKTEIDVDQEKMKRLIKEIESQRRIHKKLRIHVVASASRVPTYAFSDNESLSESRANRTIEVIKSELQKRNIPFSDISFDDIESLVRGPKYLKDAGNKEKYRKFQYVKVWIYICK